MIVIVSGLPRSGTSLAMQMLSAGGLPVLTDGIRAADSDNPRGYYEWEPVKQLSHEPSIVAQAEGRVVKVISSLLFALPAGHEYRVIFMLRPLDEVLASQAVMLRNRGTEGAKLAPAAMRAALEAHLAQVDAWLRTRPDLAVLKVSLHDVLADPRGKAESMARFVGLPLDTEAMARQVDASLHRQGVIRRP
ncbi:MAG TPA: sulfotransferase domain-containing protein [Terriglobia bacterium]|nr:sulfotransferase domain-containing protein [Terriglobia bacterium]